ncbi:DNA-directed RNA polymerases i ii and iii subunit rpabc1 [Anaeramoeba ignava]|uniref:DNA-directed RNA polymerases i ii and iii subunit rpabc1 n=1 Tax=Anaeramoeba ignava TaxID=1746090 RepID=A0A9Q0R542_ANAIG|nr:DNA-directed RNA polymerases i ii and iii subunit rpabc1 [Anaeramoeba ignava]|eukprot:Anaeramoba_ignava/a219639_16.p1 GENE.a219639_16~~a219639_16.p1  ORF type:complete len:205 (+),score=65.96 a219639_16:49-663(+)
MNQDEHYRLFKINKTILQMLHDRKYIVEKGLVEKSFEEFKESHQGNPTREDLQRMATKIEDPSIHIFIFFPPKETVGIDQIKEFEKKMADGAVHRAILVIQNKVSPFAKKYIVSLAPEKIMEIFHENELLVNITEHKLVPKHEPLTDEEKKALLERYKLKETQLPRISVDDPVARYLGLSKGQVVKIKRPSETAGRYVTYRFVC